MNKQYSDYVLFETNSVNRGLGNSLDWDIYNIWCVQILDSGALPTAISFAAFWPEFVILALIAFEKNVASPLSHCDKAYIGLIFISTLLFGVFLGPLLACSITHALPMLVYFPLALVFCCILFIVLRRQCLRQCVRPFSLCRLFIGMFYRSSDNLSDVPELMQLLEDPLIPVTATTNLSGAYSTLSHSTLSHSLNEDSTTSRGISWSKCFFCISAIWTSRSNDFFQIVVAVTWSTLFFHAVIVFYSPAATSALSYFSVTARWWNLSSWECYWVHVLSTDIRDVKTILSNVLVFL